MTFTSNERREIAARLRNEAKYMRYKQAWYEEDADLCECGNRAYRNIADSVIPGNNFNSDYILVVERLADLIDPPTCHDIASHGGMQPAGTIQWFECSECHCKAQTDKIGMALHFCPHCGAEVVE